jgi:hypothetical protein
MKREVLDPYYDDAVRRPYGFNVSDKNRSVEADLEYRITWDELFLSLT